MAGDSETGGGGSVTWAVNVDKIDTDPVETDCQDLGSGKYHQRGRDKEDTDGKNFTISIKAPGVSASQYKAQLQLPATIVADDVNGRISFTLPIDRNERNQIKISWGDHDVPHVPRGHHSHQLMASTASISRMARKKKPGTKTAKRSSKKKTAKKSTGKKSAKKKR
jgi:hypothetical protein